MDPITGIARPTVLPEISQRRREKIVVPDSVVSPSGKESEVFIHIKADVRGQAVGLLLMQSVESFVIPVTSIRPGSRSQNPGGKIHRQQCIALGADSPRLIEHTKEEILE